MRLHNFEVQNLAKEMALEITEPYITSAHFKLYGVPGSIPAAYAVRAAIIIRGYICDVVETPEACDVIIASRDSDELRHYDRYHKQIKILFNKAPWPENDPVIFPWEDAAKAAPGIINKYHFIASGTSPVACDYDGFVEGDITMSEALAEIAEGLPFGAVVTLMERTDK